jgi:signal transduction histidine kinase
MTFFSKPSHFLVIRNITSIVSSERTKNRKRYLELLTSTVSHEMMTPLNSIMNLSRSLKGQFKKAKSKLAMIAKTIDFSFDDCEKYAEIINNSSNFLHILIKDLIDLLQI